MSGTTFSTTCFIWPITIWERLNGWIFFVLLCVELLTVTSFLSEANVQFIVWLLLPQFVYVMLVFDTVYAYTLVAGTDRGKWRLSELAAAWRIVSTVGSMLLGIVTLVLLLVFAFQKDSGVYRLRVEDGGAYATIVTLNGILVIINVSQLICYWVGWPYNDLQKYKYMMLGKSAPKK